MKEEGRCSLRVQMSSSPDMTGTPVRRCVSGREVLLDDGQM